MFQIQQQARFEREETGNGSLVAPPSSLAGRAAGGAGAGAGDSSADESAFRRKILKLDESALQDYGVLPDEGGLMKAKTTEREHSNQKGQQKEDRRRGGRGGRRTAGGGGRSGGGGTGIGAENADSTEWNEIPFSWVVRGRQESHLIDQQVRLLPFCTADLWEGPSSHNYFSALALSCPWVVVEVTSDLLVCCKAGASGLRKMIFMVAT